MNGPNKSLATLRPGLGMALEEFDLAMSRKGFIGHILFPYFEVPVAADTFGKVTIESLLQDVSDERASGGGYTRSDDEFEDDSYATKEYGHEGVVDDRNAKLYANYLDSEIMCAERTRDVVMRKQEIRVASTLHDTATFTPTPVDNEWDDFANAEPVDDIEDEVRALRALGITANCLQIGWETFRNLTRCEQIIDLIQSQGAGKSVEPGSVTKEDLAKIFKLKHILVGDGQKNTAAKGLTASLSEIWSDEYAVVTRIAETNSIAEPCCGRTFHYGGDGSQVGGAFEEYREEKVRGTILRARHEVQVKVLYEAAVRLMSNIKT